MAFTGPVEDRLEIRDLYGCFGDASTRGAVGEWLACWTEDAMWNTHHFQRSGKVELRQQWDIIWTGFERVALLGEVGAIEVEGDKAHCRCVAREIVALKGGGIYKLVGQYEDVVVRQMGKWLFARRNYTPILEEAPQ